MTIRQSRPRLGALAMSCLVLALGGCGGGGGGGSAIDTSAVPTDAVPTGATPIREAETPSGLPVVGAALPTGVVGPAPDATDSTTDVAGPAVAVPGNPFDVFDPGAPPPPDETIPPVTPSGQGVPPHAPDEESEGIVYCD